MTESLRDLAITQYRTRLKSEVEKVARLAEENMTRRKTRLEECIRRVLGIEVHATTDWIIIEDMKIQLWADSTDRIFMVEICKQCGAEIKLDIYGLESLGQHLVEHDEMLGHVCRVPYVAPVPARPLHQFVKAYPTSNYAEKLNRDLEANPWWQIDRIESVAVDGNPRDGTLYEIVTSWVPTVSSPVPFVDAP